MRDPYAVLGVDKTASASEIKSAFRKLAKKLHPDSNKDDPKAQERFSEVSARLRNRRRRETPQAVRPRRNRRGRPRGFHGYPGGDPFTAYDGFDARGGSGGFSFRGADQGVAEDILSELFGSAFGGRRRSASGRNGRLWRPGGSRRNTAQPPRGKDIEAELAVTRDPILTSRKAKLKLPDGRTVAVNIPERRRRRSGHSAEGPGWSRAGRPRGDLAGNDQDHDRTEGMRSTAPDLYLDVDVPLETAINRRQGLAQDTGRQESRADGSRMDVLRPDRCA
jgi:curved DNA-binding protein CbpA